ncbi:hypothetical protein C4568_01805 [Candidatus Parcubacteria bacterium]|nr:MAG: hypothetical protein C4568_01805 [Candidatus Parcubacteria bacterium]
MTKFDLRKIGSIALLALLLVLVSSDIIPGPEEYNQTAAAAYALSGDPIEWLMKSVCVDSQDQPVPADPYYDCPQGTARRKIQPGDPLPYHNTDQYDYQQSDAYPVLHANHSTLYMQTFDFPPFDEFNAVDGSDGYDFYAVQDGWVSVAGTRDGGGFGQQFFGGNCSYGNGWIFYPIAGFLGGGSVQMPIAGSWWEQSLQSYPGTCSGVYSYPITTWELRREYAFGGVNGNPVKVMDTLVSYHGFDPAIAAPQGMEVFYFTQQYGKTRWEYWVDISQSPTKTTTCIAPDTVTYHGRTYVVKDCRDWSQVKLSSVAAIPAWPLSPANLLQHSHFDDAGGYTNASNDSTIGLWHRGGNSLEGNIINWSLLDSKASRDTRISPVGVRYLATNCAGTCAGPAVQQIYQEIPIERFVNGATYLFGAFARTQPGHGPGTIRITLQELDASDNVLWQDYVERVVDSYNGTVDAQEFKESVYLSSAYVYKTTVIPIHPGAQRIRYYITPVTPQTFHIVDTWLNPFPALTKQLGQVGDPVVALNANGQQSLAIAPGKPYTLNWASQNVRSCTLGYRSASGEEGSLTIQPNTSGSGMSQMIGSYALTCLGNNGHDATVAVAITPLPVVIVSGVEPQAGTPGSTVTIRGSGFTPSGNQIWCMSGCGPSPSIIPNATNLSSDGASISYAVPVAAPGNYGFSVQNGNGTSNTVFFNIMPTQSSVVLAAIVPGSAPPGTNVTLRGSGFTPSGNQIWCMSGCTYSPGVISNAINLSSDGTSISYFIPSTPPGPYVIAVRNANGTSNTFEFVVTAH